MGDSTHQHTTARPACPVCGLAGTAIVYGYPMPETFAAADRGEVVLGGCVIEPAMPTHECPLGHRWADDESCGEDVS